VFRSFIRLYQVPPPPIQILCSTNFSCSEPSHQWTRRVAFRIRFSISRNSNMATTRSSSHSSEDIVDLTPLLANSGGSSEELTTGRRFARRQRLRQAARFLRQASGRRMMREPSMLVREAAAEQLEERQSDWAYSKPVVVLDIIWNFAFVVVAGTVLVLSASEAPGMPLRLWILGYAMQCVLHMVCVCVEYRRRRRNQRATASVSVQDRVGSSSGNLSSSSREGSASGSVQYVSLGQLDEEGTRWVSSPLF